MCDWEGCTTGTIRLPNPKQPSVAKTSAFLHPSYIQVYRVGVPLGEILGARGGRDNLDGPVVAAGNRAIRSANRILAKHRARRIHIANMPKAIPRAISARSFLIMDQCCPIKSRIDSIAYRTPRPRTRR